MPDHYHKIRTGEDYLDYEKKRKDKKKAKLEKLKEITQKKK